MYKKILISNGWSDDNKGDSAIVEGLIESSGLAELKSIGVVSSFSGNSAHFANSMRHLQRKFDLQVYPNPVFTRCPSTKAARIKSMIELFKSFLVLAYPPISRLILDDSRRYTVDAIKDADIVIGKGGHYLFGTSNFSGFITLYRNFYTLLLARRLGVTTALSANSVGPFVGRFARVLAKIFFSTVNTIQVREKRSQEELNSLGIRSKETFDTAFVIPEEPLSVDLDLPAQFVAVTCRQWDFPYGEANKETQYENYLSAIEQACFLFSDKGYEIVLVAQVIGPTAHEDDRVVNRLLNERLRQKGLEPVVIDQDLSPGQLKVVYGKAHVLVGTRFHSVILALSAGTPVVAISYHGPKATGIMEQLGLADYVVDIKAVKSGDIRDRCNEVLGLHKEIQKSIQTVVPKIVQQISSDVSVLFAENE